MTPPKTDSRERMLTSTVALLRENGAGSTSIDRILEHSGAPRGSVYHHFPGGRVQLLDEAVALAGSLMAGVIEAAIEADDPVRGIDEFFAVWRRDLVDSRFRQGCPVLAVAVEGNDGASTPAESAGGVFAGWQEAFTALFRRHGLPEGRSRRLAALIVAAEEGAVVMCRAQQGIAPMDAVAAEIHDLLVMALEGAEPTAVAADEGRDA